MAGGGSFPLPIQGNFHRSPKSGSKMIWVTDPFENLRKHAGGLLSNLGGMFHLELVGFQVSVDPLVLYAFISLFRYSSTQSGTAKYYRL